MAQESSSSLFSGTELETRCRDLCESENGSLKINSDAAVAFAETIDVSEVVPASSPFELSEEESERSAALLLAWNALNFSYYPDPAMPRWRWLSPDGQEIGADDEANGVVAALTELNKGGDMLLANPTYLQGIDAKTLNESLFKPAPGAGPLPLAEERAAALRQVGEGLARRGCTPLGLVKAANRSAARLVAMLLEEFPLYADVQEVGSYRLPFNKRAQLCVSMLHASGVAGGFTDMECLSVFADYRIPQLFRVKDVQIFELTPRLEAEIDEGKPIARGAEDEVRLRAATVWAAALIGDALRKKEKGAEGVTQAQLDYYLWKLAVKRDAAGELPTFHRTRCTAY